MKKCSWMPSLKNSLSWVNEFKVNNLNGKGHVSQEKMLQNRNSFCMTISHGTNFNFMQIFHKNKGKGFLT